MYPPTIPTINTLARVNAGRLRFVKTVNAATITAIATGAKLETPSSLLSTVLIRSVSASDSCLSKPYADSIASALRAAESGHFASAGDTDTGRLSRGQM